MFSGKDAANPAYPTQWALNPTAYQNVDSNSVDWASLAQQWIAMKDAAAIINVPVPSAGKPENVEEGEAPMEVENPDSTAEANPPAGAEWNSATNAWGSTWNQWGWGWDGTGVDPKVSGDPTMGMAPMVDSYSVPTDTTGVAAAGYSTGPAPTFQHGYWTAQPDPTSSRSSSNSHDRSSKSKTRDYKPRNRARGGLTNNRDKATLIPHMIDPAGMPSSAMSTPIIDAAKRRQLPAWIREGLEKMEREKQRAIEREEEKRVKEEEEKERKRLEAEELERMKAVAGGQPMLPTKSKFESDSGEEEEQENEAEVKPRLREPSVEESPVRKRELPPPSPPKRTAEEIMQEAMLTVRRSLTEILLEVTDQEIHTVSQEELARFNVVQASRLNAMKASKSKALASIASGLGLGAYESSSEESGDEDNKELSDYQLQEIIRRKNKEFERTSREIEAEVTRAEREEQRVLEDGGTPRASPQPDTDGSSTPPPVGRETTEKYIENKPSKERRNSNKSHDRVDGHRKLDTIPDEKSKKSNKRERTPSTPTHKSHKESSTSKSSESEEDSSSSASESSEENHSEAKTGTKKAKKRKRRSSGESHRKSKKSKSHKSDEKSKKRDNYDKVKSKKKDDREKHKSSRSRDERSHRDKYRDDSVDRPRKRSKRSRSVSYESRSEERRRRDHSYRERSYDKGRDHRDRSHDRGRDHRDRSHDKGRDHRDRSYDKGRDHRDRSYDKGRDYDRYERSRDDRRRSHSSSRSRHRR